ncbi:hypothetical protein GCM10027290_57000 [Micromonospora sonneratiae]|uniref:DUF262 domain-containing protein n=1 Tax=Micromonospora sonneratiae TaxID=1184706 RepID=A0ABW3YHP0_9ACTN
MLEGERIDLQSRRNVVNDLSDDLINEKYVRGEVRIVTEQARYPLSSIPQLLESGDYLLRPDYQRRRRWSTEKKSRLIESLVMNVPIPPIFLYEFDYSKYEVMDGLQRLSTIRDFYANAFALQGLVEWEELNGRTYSSLPTSVRAGIDRRYLSSIILLQETARNETEARALKQLVFERINSGGEKLTPQETRNAVYGGLMNELCLALSRRPSLCLTWGIPVGNHEEEAADPDHEEDAELLENDAYREMFDVELVLRFFAFRQDPQYLAKSLRDYFDEYLKRANRFDSRLIYGLGKLFEATIDLVYEVFGERAFWLWRQRNGRWNWLSRPTTVAYDTIMFAMSQRIHQKGLILEYKDELVARLPGFYVENYSSFAGRYTNPSNIILRRELFGAFIDGVLGDGRR